MSVAALSEADKIYKKSFHRRNDSGELDVFEAARYFSGGNEIIGYNGAAFPHRMMVMREESRQGWRGGRISLDMPMRNSQLPAQSSHAHVHVHAHAHAHTHAVEKQMKEKIKYKQPSSPGGRLASFLNSLFNQTNSKKKKSKSTAQSIKDEEESPGGRRKRRSSISHFQSSSTADSKSSVYSSSSSGFRTPPPYAANTPIKTYKDFRSYSDHRQVVSLPNGNVKGAGTGTAAALDEKRIKELAWLDEKFRFSNGFSDQKHKNFRNGISERERSWAEECPLEEKELMRKLVENEIDGGAESDSSSDLFELQNYELGGCYSSGLPVYETTHMDTTMIKRSGAPISNSNARSPLPL